jgi:CelD/BcsL family acetyltransferase involved in cellulose biosynthesis
VFSLELLEVDNFESLKADWNKLLSKSLDNNPFLTYEWLTTWWKFFGQEKKLKIFVAKNQGQIVLIAPQMRTDYDRLGVNILKKSEFVASPNSDYHTFILTNFDESQKIMKKLIKDIYEVQNSDVIIFGEVPETSYTAKLLQNIQIEGYTIDHSVCSPCPYIELPSDPKTFLQTLGSNMRHNLKKCEADATEKFHVNFINYKEMGSIENAMKAFFALHQRRQTSEGREGYFSSRNNEQFHVEIAKKFAEKDYLALFFLTFNDVPVSSVYCYEYNNKLYAYLCGFDPEYAEYRPGYLVFKKAIEYGINKGLKEFDFMRGSEEYKTRWKATVRNNYEYRVLKNNIKTKLYEYLKTRQSSKNKKE